MGHAKQQTQTNGPSLKARVHSLGLGTVRRISSPLENEALAAAAARTHLDVRELLAISVAQTVVLLAIAVVVGFRTIQVCPKDLRALPVHPESAVSWHSGFRGGAHARPKTTLVHDAARRRGVAVRGTRAAENTRDRI